MINDKIKKRVLELSEQERAELAHLLIDSLHSEKESGSEKDWSEELKRRIDKYERGESSTNSWKNVNKTARSLLDR